MDNKMRRKYLEDINIVEEPPTLWCLNDERQKTQWEKEREEYGFDEREIWDLHYTFYCWLYERLKMYIERACVDLEDDTFKYKGETLTQKQCIDKMLEGLELALTKQEDNLTMEELCKIDDIPHIWALILSYMWT